MDALFIKLKDKDNAESVWTVYLIFQFGENFPKLFINIRISR